MPICYDPQLKTFHLTTCASSYVFQRGPEDKLLHLGWGPLLPVWGGSNAPRPVERAFSPVSSSELHGASWDTLPQEFPLSGGTDFRSPALRVRLNDGGSRVDLNYVEHRQLTGKPPLTGLPCTYVEVVEEADTLEVDLEDSATKLRVTLVYTAYRDRDVLVRSVRLFNGGSEPIEVQGLHSVSLDLDDANWHRVTLPGAWARERSIDRRPLAPGLQLQESRRGASSHQHHPFLGLVRPNTDEDVGEARGLSLVYSGNFAMLTEVDQFLSTRVQAGFSPEGFTWKLLPGESLQAPEVILVRSSEGLGGLSRTFHKLFSQRLARGPWRDRERPILINNWEATYFNFNTERILKLADQASSVGIELFVLDDGWFGTRDNDRSSLGDWTVDRRKLPEGLEDLGSKLLDRGLTFGLWFEPEMVSPNSNLYRAHSDWCLHFPGRSRSEGRNQLVLDLCRPEVQDYLVESISTILREAPISYVKWDMNRHHTEAGSPTLPPDRQGEVAHRFILGLYSVLERITAAFPAVLFESCSGGGGRFDPGLLFYMPQGWASDNTDAVARLEILWGTSLVYPPAAIGAHVSAVPNHQVQRVTPLETRFHVARTGAFGYELDLGTLSESELNAVRQQIVTFRQDRRLLQFGTFYRLSSPAGNNDAAWMSVSDDRCTALVTFVLVLAVANSPQRVLLLRGLDPERSYHCAELAGRWSGQELMAWGLRLPDLRGDFASLSLRLAVSDDGTAHKV